MDDKQTQESLNQFTEGIKELGDVPVCPRVQKLPQLEHMSRVETGAVQFGNDWPGLFLRGDDAFKLALCIQSVCNALPNANKPDAFSFASSWLEHIAEEIHSDVIVRHVRGDSVTPNNETM